MKPRTIYGVDFSGAKLAGRNIWIAQCRSMARVRLRLDSLDCLDALCGTPERRQALRHLVHLIESSTDAIWGIDFPFGLPIEVVEDSRSWHRQLAEIARCPDDAYQLGLACVERARKIGDSLHIRRTTDRDVKTPFDCYHYRIIYQTFHGMRDVLLPLSRHRGTAILPFHYHRLGTARRLIVEACPSSTLKRLAIPHQNYKQPVGGALSRKRRATRHAILDRLRQVIDIDERFARIMMRNPGGDAIDAVVAAVGTHQAWQTADHRAIARHARYPREGYIYA